MQLISACFSIVARRALDIASHLSMNNPAQLPTFLKISSLLPRQVFYLCAPLFWYKGPYNLLHVGERYPSAIHCVFDPPIHPVNVILFRMIIRYPFTIDIDKGMLLYSVAADVDGFSVLGLPKIYGDIFFSVRERDTLVMIEFVFIRGFEIVDETVY